nr:MAG TPA: hypothetical protein [Caudoviricetes sp.]
MRKYRVMYHKGMGYAAMMKADGMQFWQQVSLWYTSLGRLNYYWGKRNGITLPAHGEVEY